MTSQIFDQKIFKPANEMYYFQLIPNYIRILNPTFAKSLKTSNS